MSELQDNFKKIMDDLEANIENKKDLDYIKKQVYQISILFIDELDKMADLNMNKMNAMIERHKELNDRIAKLESTMNTIEKELFVDEWSDFEITCPYCNHEFAVDFSKGVQKEVTCPECDNVIELDWNQEVEQDCMGHCASCESNCVENENEEQEDDDDDM